MSRLLQRFDFGARRSQARVAAASRFTKTIWIHALNGSGLLLVCVRWFAVMKAINQADGV